MILSGHAEDRKVIPDDASCDDEKVVNTFLSLNPVFHVYPFVATSIATVREVTCLLGSLVWL